MAMANGRERDGGLSAMQGGEPTELGDQRKEKVNVAQIKSWKQGREEGKGPRPCQKGESRQKLEYMERSSQSLGTGSVMTPFFPYP